MGERMDILRTNNTSRTLAAILMMSVAACSGGGSDSSSAPPPPAGGSTPAPAPPPSDLNGAFVSNATTSRFLSQSTFGPTDAEISSLTGTSASEWYLAELAKPASLSLPIVNAVIAQEPDDDFSFTASSSPTFAFWENAVSGDDQLRQRMAFALSQILVISMQNDELFGRPEAVAYYQDILARNAFGNFRQLLEEVTYSPAMGAFLTYLQNQKGDPITGRVPDENYAREIMQLFSIGLVLLEPDGDVILDGSGDPIETYSNEDITGLARVFTGLSIDDPDFFFDFNGLDPDAFAKPMVTFPAFHSDLAKSFLGETIPANTGPDESIDRALDIIFNHPNVAPFICRQLIQRFITSSPSSAYVGRVAAVFESGTYTLPNGTAVGATGRGDLAATLAAILFDPEAQAGSPNPATDFGKIREPILRFVQWARAFNAQTVTPEFTLQLWDTGSANELAQRPYGAPSVFNFYRPGYIAPGTETGAAGLTIPELQIVNANSVAGFANFMTFFVFGFAEFAVDNELVRGVDAQNSFLPDYTVQLALADNPQALVDNLDMLLANQSLSTETRDLIISVVTNIPLTFEFDPDYDGALFRVQTAVMMVMTSPDYIVQR